MLAVELQGVQESRNQVSVAAQASWVVGLFEVTVDPSVGSCLAGLLQKL